MLGTTKPFLRHVVMSTGRKDWARDISEEKDSLADLLQECIEADFAERKEEEGKSKDKSDGEGERKIALPEGCWQTAGADAPAKLTLTNGSHHSTSSVSWGQSIMLFPDWVLLSDVPSAKADAKSSGAPPKEQVQKHVNAAYEAWMAPDAPRMGAIKRVRELAPPENGIPQQRMRRWALLYRAVVLLCKFGCWFAVFRWSERSFLWARRRSRTTPICSGTHAQVIFGCNPPDPYSPLLVDLPHP